MCGTAALHSFGISLRHQLKNTSVKVVEVLPGPVDTDMAAQPLPDGRPPTVGVNADEYAADTVEQLLAGVNEIAFGTDFKALLRADRNTLDAITEQFNA